MNSHLLHFNSVTELWKWNSTEFAHNDAVIHWTAEVQPFRWTYSSLFSRAVVYSSYIQSLGIKKGEVCALIIRHNKEFYPLYMGICIAGAVPAVLAYPNPRLHPEKFKEGIDGMSQRSGLDWIFTEAAAGMYLEELIRTKKTTIKGLFYPFDNNLKNNYSDHNDISESGEAPLLLQHSSGTTGLQKPVLLTHKSVLQHLRNYSEAIKLKDNDKIVSWLPLYHDMGLIAAFHLPLALGIPLVQIDPFEWISVPSLLPQCISSEKGTISWLPNFAFNILADKVKDDELENISLDSWRLVINCSEPVRYESHLKFLTRYRQYGLKEASLSTSYAMAETVFAVTQTPPGEYVKEVIIDGSEFLKGKIKQVVIGKKILSSGKLIKGSNIKIVNNNREIVAVNEIGEIAINSDSLFEGYRNYPEKSAKVLSDGWYYSGDLGFCIDGYYFITGRKKDIIIVAGNNIYPEDIETAVGRVEGVIPGRVIAAGEYDEELGSEQITIIAETACQNEIELIRIKRQIILSGMEIDVSIRNVYLVPPRWLIKSSAGKLSRKANIERIRKEIKNDFRQIKKSNT